jgi:opacity protein-like surface antigen
MTANRPGQTTRRMLLLMIVIGALAATAAPAAAATPYPATRAIQLPTSGWSVQATGPIAGWYWMRSPTYGDTATYRFDSFDPAVLGYDHKLTIALAPLVTNTTSGGAGWTTRVHVVVTYSWTGGSKTWTYHVSLINPFPFRSALDSAGVGYQAYGARVLQRSQFTHGPGALKIVVTRESSSVTFGYHPHVAVSATAVTVWYLVR